MRIERTSFLDLHFDRLSFSEVKSRLQSTSAKSRYEYIVTPNVDHIVRIHREPQLRVLYDNADLCVCDSRVLAFLARLRGVKLSVVPGSDLTAVLFAEIIASGDRIAIVGGDSACLQALRSKFPQVEFLHFEPPMNLRRNLAARAQTAAFVASSGARFALLAVGSPQQEMIAYEIRRHPSAAGIALCIGAGLDFVTGKQKRAPKLMQSMGLEWAHRLLSNPRRLWRRYVIDGIRIFPIWMGWRRTRNQRVLSIALATLLGAIGAAGALYAVASMGRRASHGSSVDIRLPHASEQSAAAVESLPPPNLLKPLSSQEASEENSERPFVPRSDTPAKPFFLRTDPDDRARALTCLAQAVYYEAASQGVDGGRAVAQVVLNRLRHPGFPSTVCGVVYEGADRPTGCQFSFTCDGSMQRVPVPFLWARSKKLADEALKGHVFAEVGHATHYHANYVLPYWADSLDKSAQIGRHIFYRLRSVYGDAPAFSQHYRGTEPPVREPGAAVVIGASPEGQQLADKLIGAGSSDTQKMAETPAPKPEIPLMIDQTPSALLLDGQARPQRQHRAKSSDECPGTSAGQQLGPLKATDMRSDASHSAC